MSRSYDSAIKEAVFIVLPIAVLFVLKAIGGDLISFFKMSDFSLASSIMYGQLLAKTLDVPDERKVKERFTTYQVYIFAYSILSVAIYVSFQTTEKVHIAYNYLQIALFVLGILFYIPLSTLMTNLSKK